MLTELFWVTKLTDSGNANTTGTLSWAIDRANNNLDTTELNVIKFDLPGTPQDTLEYITVSGALPAITARNVEIDGRDLESGKQVILDANANVTALVYQGGANGTGSFNVHHITIDDFNLDGIHVESLGGNDTVTISNVTLLRNNASGIRFSGTPWGASGRFTIENCYITQNNGDGIVIENSSSPATASMRSVIKGNNIGYNQSGSALNNGGVGVKLGSAAANIDILDNNFYTQSVGISLTSAAGIGNRVSTDVLSTAAANQFKFVTAGGMPIDLMADNAPEPRDSGDGDSGPNNRQNSPEILTKEINYVGSSWQIPFRLDSPPGQYTFDLYVQPGGANGTWVWLAQGTQTIASSATVLAFNISDVGKTYLGSRVAVVATGGASSSEFGISTLRELAPTIVDVKVRGTGWTTGVDYSFATLFSNGQQLRPIPTQGVDVIEIRFSEQVNLVSGNSASAATLTLAKTTRDASGPNAAPVNSIIYGNGSDVGFVYDSVNFIASWTFPSSGANSLADGKYAIYLKASDVADVSGLKLDADWSNNFGPNSASPTADVYSDDLGRPFVTGDGTVNSSGTNFRLNFALLAGDYNGDGIVTTTAVSGGPAVDVTAASDRWTDGNGDGVFTANNAADLAVRDAVGNAGDYLPLRRLANGAGFYGADLKDDEYVDGSDLALWKTTFGTGGNGDINGDGVTDGADFLLWQISFGAYTAWSNHPYLGAPTAAAMASIVSAPPRVMNVVISGSASTHAPFSMDTVDGSGTQLKTVPVGGADTISIVFDQAMNIAAEHLIVVGLQTFNLPDLTEFSYDAATFTATWQFEGWALGDQYLLALSDMATSVDGNWLDGEWTNPATTTTVNSLVSEFPSGDGNVGGAFKFVITLLPGDANLDGAVNSLDLSILAVNYNILTGRLFTQGDFNGDGATNIADYSALSSNWGRSLQSLSMRADFDGDFDVDAADLNVIGTNAGMTSGATWANGDLDADGDVDMDDLDLAFAQFGQTLSVVS